MGFHSYTAPKILQWSYSRYTTYKECPLKARLKFIQKLEEPGNQYLENGIRVHKLVEDYLKGAIPLNAELGDLAEVLGRAKELGAESELELAFDADWQPVGWFDKEAWVRVKADILIGPMADGTLVLVDVKTGKQRDYTEQLELYALAAFKKWPEVSAVEAAIWYVTGGATDFISLTRSAEEELTAKWNSKVEPMLNDDIFAARPGNYCRYCHFRKDNGGPCNAA